MPDNLPFPLNLLRTIQNPRPKLFVEMQFVYLAQNARSSRDAEWNMHYKKHQSIKFNLVDIYYEVS